MKEDFSIIFEPGFWAALALSLALLFGTGAVIWSVQQ
jgi:hypothetical protein